MTMRPEQLPEEFGAAEAEFSAALRRWEGAIATAAAEDLPAIVPYAVNELDQAWPYYGQLCSFRGKAVYPEVEGESESLRVAAGEYTGEGFSQGFAAHDFDESGRPRLYYMFWVDQRSSSPHPVIYLEQRLFVFLDTSGVVVPVIEIENALNPEPNPLPELSEEAREAVCEGIDATSKILVELYRSTTFRRMALKKQRALIDKFIAGCNQDYGLREAAVLLEADYCCRASFQGSDVTYDFLPIRDSVVKGTFLGFGTLERAALDTKAIRRDADMWDRGAGLCLIVEVQEASEPTPLRSTDIVLVPLSSQDPEVHFIQEVDAAVFEPGPPDANGGLAGPDGLVRV